jgi:hypothetical protein
MQDKPTPQFPDAVTGTFAKQSVPLELYESTLPEEGPTPNIPQSGTKVRLATSKHQEELATFVEAMSTKCPDDCHQEGHNHLSTLDFKGFQIPDGNDMVMVFLHAEKNPDGTVIVPKIRVCLNHHDWKTWVRSAITIGLQRGSVMAQDMTTALHGFSCVALDNDNNRIPTAFAFTQIASVLPFRDIAESNERRNAVKRAKEMAVVKKARLKKLAAKSRRNNRK